MKEFGWEDDEICSQERIKVARMQINQVQVI